MAHDPNAFVSDMYKSGVKAEGSKGTTADPAHDPYGVYDSKEKSGILQGSEANTAHPGAGRTGYSGNLKQDNSRPANTGRSGHPGNDTDDLGHPVDWNGTAYTWKKLGMVQDNTINGRSSRPGSMPGVKVPTKGFVGTGMPTSKDIPKSTQGRSQTGDFNYVSSKAHGQPSRGLIKRDSSMPKPRQR